MRSLLKSLPRIEHISAFSARRVHLGFEQFDLSLLHLKRALGDLAPVELDEVLDDLKGRDYDTSTKLWDALRL